MQWPLGQLDAWSRPWRSCVHTPLAAQAVVLAQDQRLGENSRMPLQEFPPSPAPWTYAERLYGISHCLVDRDGRVISCNLPIGNGPLLEQAPAAVELLRDLVAGIPPEQLRQRAAFIAAPDRSACSARAWLRR